MFFRLIARIAKAYNHGRLPYPASLLMATIDHALAADTGLHDGSWARNFFFSHEEEWLSGERALTLSDFPEEYLTDLANEEEAPPSSSSRTIAGKWMSYQWLADRLTDSEVDHHRFPMAFKIGALSMDWAYHDSKVYRLQGFEGLNDTEQDVLIAKVKADLGTCRRLKTPAICLLIHGHFRFGRN
jgi:hypothetical protein